MARFATGAIENRSREIKSLVVRADHVGTQEANVLLEVSRTVASDGALARKQLYVQALVALPPAHVMTFDDIFADADTVSVNVVTSGPGQEEVAVTVTARDAQRRAIPGLVSQQPARIIEPFEKLPQSGNIQSPQQ